MKRSMFFLIAVLLPGFGFAQAPRRAASAAELVGLHQQNRPVLDGLVETSLALSRPNTNSLAKSETYPRLLRSMGEQIEKAARAQDAARVAELTQLLERLIEKGFFPQLEQARRAINPGSREEPRLNTTRDQAVQVVRDIEGILPADGGDPVIRRSLEGLRGLKKQLQELGTPPQPLP